MEAKELRIGNWVNIPVSVNGIVIGISMDDCETLFGNHPSDDIYGIPLTEEWIEDLNFTKSDALNDHFGGMLSPLDNNGNRMRIRQDTNGNWYYTPNNIGPIVWVDYVHQLQNLYFALTGKELEVKQ